MEAVYIDTIRKGYSLDQCGRTLTVRDLIAALEEFDEDTPVYLRNDGGYTYGNITEASISFSSEEV